MSDWTFSVWFFPLPRSSTVGSITPVPFRASVAWAWVIPGAAIVHSVPPLNSIPRFSPPRRMMETIPSTMMRLEMLNQIFRRPTKSKRVSPRYRRAIGPWPRRGFASKARAATSTETSSSSSSSPTSTLSSSCSTSSSLTSSRALRRRRRLALAVVAHDPPPPAAAPAMPPAPTTSGSLGARAEPGGDAEGTRALEPLALPEEDHERPGVEPGDGHVHDRREPEEEREALHVAHGHEVQDDGRQQGDEVRGPDRPPGALEAAVHRRPHGASGPGLVLQSLEIDDVRVDGDADGHDQTGDAGQVEARRDRRVTETRDDGPQHHGREDEPRDHDQPERPVVRHDVEQDEDQAADPRGEPGDEGGVAERGRDGLGRCGLQA